MSGGGFTHLDEAGNARMVDIGSKEITHRSAVAEGKVVMNPDTYNLIREGKATKGNVIGVSRVAGIMAAKKNADLIPMCHPLLLTYVDVHLEIDHEQSGVAIFSEIRLEGKTGAEMEALTAVSVAALTVYDMCKAVDKNMIIEDIQLVEKKGGKSDYLLK